MIMFMKLGTRTEVCNYVYEDGHPDTSTLRHGQSNQDRGMNRTHNAFTHVGRRLVTIVEPSVFPGKV